jgi:lysophospholipase L1-like esterase
VSNVTAVPSYYVALGDSISAGDYASSPLAALVGLIYQHEQARYPGLEVANFACGGATSEEMIYGSAECDYNVTSQLGYATAFLRAHQGQVRFITLDIGINDIVAGESNRQTFLNLLHILVTLQHADPGVEIVGMNYYDPFVANPASTPSWGSPAAFAALNTTLSGAYKYANVSMVDVASLFGTTTARLCSLTYQCAAPPLQNLHPTDAGYAVLAKAFEADLP